jgi:hypothetical protein
MSHCPQCGKPTPEGAVACPFCGVRLVASPGPYAQPRTMVGVSAQEIAARRAAEATAPIGTPAKVHRTIVGMPASALPPPQAPAAVPSKVNRTLLGMSTIPMAHVSDALADDAPTLARGDQRSPAVDALTLPRGDQRSPAADALSDEAPTIARGDHRSPAAGAAPPTRAGGTLLGVARPGIAPLNPGAVPEPEGPPPGYQPAGELGATIAPARGVAWGPPPSSRKPNWDGGRHRWQQPSKGARPGAKGAPPREGPSRRAMALIFAAGGLALVAVLFAVFWPSPPPLSARARADASGKEGVELTCSSCPDGTKVAIGEATATIASGTAIVPLPSALAVGENRLKVAIDRPGSGRDETVSVPVNVAYRIHPDLKSLDAERPSFQIVAEAAKGTAITVDGRALPLAGGRAVENVDVSAECTGLSADVKTLSRQIPYVVTPEGGGAENGSISVSVGIVALHLDAPGPHVIIDKSSFVLAGRTTKGAELLAAGRPITVKADGTFAQVMNVSSIGATQIEVRARMAGMAPRRFQIRVRRVDNLETAAREFASESPITYDKLAGNVPAQIGKAVTLAGEVSEARKQGYQTVMLLDVSAASGCRAGSTCTVRLVQGDENPAKRGDALRVYGHVSRLFSVPGRADLPEIEVDFTIKGRP